MSKSTRNFVTATNLKEMVTFGSFTPEQRNYITRLNARLPQIGEKIGTAISRSHVSAGGFAMPVSFEIPVYGISRQKFSAMLRHQTALPAPIPPRRKS
jgi:hypothetical protein